MSSGDDVLEALPVAVYRTDAEGNIKYYNEAAAALWGHRPPVDGKWCGSWKLYTSDGSPLPHDECPMAVTLKTGVPVRGVDAVLERPDGERIPFQPFPTPLRDASGNIIGAINLLVDLRDRERVAVDTARLASIVSSSDDAIISKTLDGKVTSWNQGAERIFGYTAEEMIGQPILRLIPPELQDEEKDIIARLGRGERIDHFETVRISKDGQRIDISLTVSPLKDLSGRIVGASKVARDISDRRRHDEIRRLLVDELNHRIKNTLATVQAIASQTLRRAQNPAEFVTSFNGRIHALACAHGLLTSGSFQGADILQLVRDQLLIGNADDNRIRCSGPSVVLDAQAALHLALVLHELGTNARKHGALSKSAGVVDVGWELHTNGQRKLRLIWRESNGPQVKAPMSRGFGSMLIEHSLQAHGGEVRMNYAETGVTCTIDLPLPELERPIGDLARATARHSAESQPRGLNGKRILVVEDEALISLVLVDYLLEAGCHVVGPAQTLNKAKVLVAEEEFDAALVDGNLAGQCVDELARALTQKGAPFVFVTGYGREALPAGYQDAIIVEKPFTQDQVIGALERVFAPNANVVQLKQRKSDATPT